MFVSDCPGRHCIFAWLRWKGCVRLTAIGFGISPSSEAWSSTFRIQPCWHMCRAEAAEAGAAAVAVAAAGEGVMPR